MAAGILCAHWIELSNVDGAYRVCEVGKGSVDSERDASDVLWGSTRVGFFLPTTSRRGLVFVVTVLPPSVGSMLFSASLGMEGAFFFFAEYFTLASTKKSSSFLCRSSPHAAPIRDVPMPCCSHEVRAVG